MTEYILGIDTSCYTTSLAAVSKDGQVLESLRKMLSVPLGERGLRQSEAVFQHVKQLPELMEEIRNHLPGGKIIAVCVSARPRDEESSYMPVFQAGVSLARSIAAALGVPFFTTCHQRGHIAAAKVSSGTENGDLLAVHLSGGTTEILALQGEELTLLGGSKDLHAGQMIDRVGVAMGMKFPAGKYMEQLAYNGETSHLLPVSIEKGDRSSCWCHMSGAESQCQRWIQQGIMPRENIAREVFDFIGRTVAKMLESAHRQTGINQALVAGGVATSSLIRSIITDRLGKTCPDMAVHFGKPEYSGDNAAGVGIIGAEKLRGKTHGSENT